ncbi:LysE/ArgO family amino acid transporter [Ostreibacterium oceani]|uniref:Amino acid transporter n=1 Tax=Ostreibacterium oceani TaxID=2654998 RepID=A0A6N7F176_9GAMM|nr:LysE family transporter [Ostreibacterium oceani]MPV85606.1 amino acid transporter [Ostreibacterium oceani]
MLHLILDSALLQGFLLGGSLIVAIGAQNAFVLTQSLRAQHEWKVATVCALSDILLIAVGIAGVSVLVSQYPMLTQWIAGFGVVFLFVYGALSFRRMFFPQRMGTTTAAPMSAKKTIAIALGLTFLNPHVYLDTMLLIASIANARFPDTVWLFALGAMMASLVWFYGLTAFAKLLVPLFQRPLTWRILDGMIGCVMWLIAYSLLALLR